MNVADRTRWERMCNAPGKPAIAGTVDANFVAIRIVEVFSPEHAAIGNGGDVQRPGTPLQAMSDSKFRFSGAQCSDGCGHSSDQIASRRDCQRVKTIAEQTKAEIRMAAQVSPPLRTIVGRFLPLEYIFRSCTSGKQHVAARGVENIAVPHQRPQFWESCDWLKSEISLSRGNRESLRRHMVQFSDFEATKGPTAIASIFVRWKQLIASSGSQTIGSFSLKLVFKTTGMPVCRSNARIKS